jgi:hypothetical protein
MFILAALMILGGNTVIIPPPLLQNTNIPNSYAKLFSFQGLTASNDTGKHLDVLLRLLGTTYSFNDAFSRPMNWKGCGSGHGVI